MSSRQSVVPRLAENMINLCMNAHSDILHIKHPFRLHLTVLGTLTAPTTQ